MFKNLAGQRVGAQMIALDGSPFTGAVTVYVTGDAGTQAVGSVGSGACVHEGNGYHTYAPAQAETNYDLAAFTFVGTGAAPATVQVYTRAGDAYVRLGAPAGASIAADIAAVQADTNDLQTRTPAALVGGRVDANVGAMAANVLTAAATAADYVTEMAGAATTALNTYDPPTMAELTTALGTADDAVLAAVAAVQADTDALQTTLGAAGAGLTAVPWNAAWDAEVQSECADALATYDPPTNAEMVARTLVAADYATAAALATVDTVVDAIDARLPSDPADQSLLLASTTAIYDRIGATGSGLTSLASAAAVAAVDAVTDKLDSAMQLDGSVYRFTANALELAPTGSGGGGTPPTVEEIADEVQTRTIARVTLVDAVTVVNGLANNTVTAAALAADAGTELRTGLATSAELTAAVAPLATTAGLGSLATASAVDALPTNAELAAALDPLATTLELQAVRLSATGLNDILRTALTESYAENGDPATLSQLLYMLQAVLSNRRVQGDILRVYGLDGATQVATFLLDDVAAPTEQLRQT